MVQVTGTLGDFSGRIREVLEVFSEDLFNGRGVDVWVVCCERPNKGCVITYRYL